jgi:hypothetical protein
VKPDISTWGRSGHFYFVLTTPSPSRSPGSRGNLTPTTGRYEDELRKVGGRWLLHVRRGIIEMPG